MLGLQTHLIIWEGLGGAVADRSRVPVWEGDSESIFSLENFPCF